MAYWVFSYFVLIQMLVFFFLSCQIRFIFRTNAYIFLNSLCTFCQVLKKELSCLGTLAREGKTCNEHISNSFFGVCAVTMKTKVSVIIIYCHKQYHLVK